MKPPVKHFRRLVSMVLLAGLTGSVMADVPRLISYQGKLVGQDAGPVSLTLTFYNASVGGAVLFSEMHAAVPLVEGVFSVLIGGPTANGVPDSALNAAEVWLGVSVNGGAELTPRTRIVMTPYAAKAAAAERLVVPGGFSNVARTDAQGNLSLFDLSNNAAFRFGTNTVGTAGELSMFAADGTTETVEIVAAESSSQGSRVRLGLPSGATTLTLDADFLSLGTPAISLSDGTQTNLLLSGSAGGTILFGPGNADPLIVAGHDNNAARPKRMWISHSAGSENWGIQYRDLVSDGLQNDSIEFVAGDTTRPVFRFDLPGRRFHLSDGTYDAVDLYASASGGGAALTLRNSAGTATVLVDSDEGDDAAQLELLRPSGDGGVVIDAHEGTAGGAALYLYDAATPPVNSVEIDAVDGTAGGAAMRLRNAAGTVTITLDANYGADGDGRIITQELQITGGSDLSEQFDINVAVDSHADPEPQPGMVVCIDPSRPGELIVSSRDYDRTVAGVISGAGGVKPGMTMGQTGTRADGARAVALTGRVYCWVDASHGAVEPGDLLTTSDTPGHAMKALDHVRAPGAVIGKAMTRLELGKGLVLVLVSLQ
jgi:hypothetical protein